MTAHAVQQLDCASIPTAARPGGWPLWASKTCGSPRIYSAGWQGQDDARPGVLRPPRGLGVVRRNDAAPPHAVGQCRRRYRRMGICRLQVNELDLVARSARGESNDEDSEPDGLRRADRWLESARPSLDAHPARSYEKASGASLRHPENDCLLGTRRRGRTRRPLTCSTSPSATTVKLMSRATIVSAIAYRARTKTAWVDRPCRVRRRLRVGGGFLTAGRSRRVRAWRRRVPRSQLLRRPCSRSLRSRLRHRPHWRSMGYRPTENHQELG